MYTDWEFCTEALLLIMSYYEPRLTAFHQDALHFSHVACMPHPACRLQPVLLLPQLCLHAIAFCFIMSRMHCA